MPCSPSEATAPSRATACRLAGASFTYLREHFECGRYLVVGDDAFRDEVLASRYGTVDGRVNLEAMELKPLLADDDDFFFAFLGGERDPTPPFKPYPANRSQVGRGGNPFAPAAFHGRWYEL